MWRVKTESIFQGRPYSTTFFLSFNTFMQRLNILCLLITKNKEFDVNSVSKNTKLSVYIQVLNILEVFRYFSLKVT